MQNGSKCLYADTLSVVATHKQHNLYHSLLEVIMLHFRLVFHKSFFVFKNVNTHAHIYKYIPPEVFIIRERRKKKTPLLLYSTLFSWTDFYNSSRSSSSGTPRTTPPSSVHEPTTSGSSMLEE